MHLLFVLLLGTILCNAKYQIKEEDSVQYSQSRMISLRYDCQNKNDPTTHCCSGIILTESYILTAADCIDSFPSDMTIVAGIHNRFRSDETIRKVDQIIIHPSWKNDFKYNIALLHISSPFDFRVDEHITQTFSPIDLNYPFKSTQLLVIQWNSLKQNFEATTSVNLQQNEMSLVDDGDQQCKGLVHDIKQQFCVRFYHASKSLFLKKYR